MIHGATATNQGGLVVEIALGTLDNRGYKTALKKTYFKNLQRSHRSGPEGMG